MINKNMNNMRIGLFAGSFDPPTLGHIDLISRASHLVDKLFIGIGINPNKRGLLPSSHRVQLLREIVADPSFSIPIEIHEFEGLTVSFAKKIHASVLIRGLRTEADLSLEIQMATMNKNLEENLETIFLATSPQYAQISSSLVREVYGLGGSIEKLVPPQVIKYLLKPSKI